jgi:hypothetical protein
MQNLTPDDDEQEDGAARTTEATQLVAHDEFSSPAIQLAASEATERLTQVKASFDREYAKMPTNATDNHEESEDLTGDSAGRDCLKSMMHGNPEGNWDDTMNTNVSFKTAQQSPPPPLVSPPKSTLPRQRDASPTETTEDNTTKEGPQSRNAAVRKDQQTIPAITPSKDPPRQKIRFGPGAIGGELKRPPEQLKRTPEPGAIPPTTPGTKPPPPPTNPPQKTQLNPGTKDPPPPMKQPEAPTISPATTRSRSAKTTAIQQPNKSTPISNAATSRNKSEQNKKEPAKKK